MKAKKGFSILFALGFMSAFVVIATTYISSVLYLNSLALERHRTEYRYWATRGLLELGKSYILRGEYEQPVVISYWPAQEHPHTGKILFSIEPESIMVTAQLLQGNLIVYRLESRVADHGAQKPSIAL